MLHWVGREGHMNTYQGGRTSQGKIIPIKRHFASSIFGIISPLVGSTPPPPPDKYSYEVSKHKLVYIWNNIYHINTYSQHTIYKDVHKVTSLIKSFQNFCLTLVYSKIFRTSLHLAISLREIPLLNAFDVDAERREWDLNALVWIPALCKISDTHLASVLDDTGLSGGAYLIKNMEFWSCLSAAVLSRYNLINATTHRETSCGYALNSIGCWWDFGREVFNNFDM